MAGYRERGKYDPEIPVSATSSPLAPHKHSIYILTYILYFVLDRKF